MQIVQNEETTSKEFIIYQIGRQHNILEQIIEIICSQGNINLDGFFRFRLKKYLGMLYDAIDLAVDEFMLEKEYNEFVRLLKYFLDIQESRIPIAHVYFDPNSQFQLYDHQGQRISNEIIEGFNSDLIDTDVSYEDILISALITSAPENVVLHFVDGYKGGEEVNTIYAVFGDHVHHCPGCERCLASHSGQER